MPAGRFNFTIEQGTTFRARFIVRDKATRQVIDLTGYSARMQLRREITSPTPLLDLDTGTKGGLDIVAAEGEVVLEITPTQSAALNVDSAVYDLELVAPGGDVTRLLKGKVKVDPEVTRD